MSFACPSCGVDLPDSYVEVNESALSAGMTSASCPDCGAALPGSFIGPTVAYTPEADDEFVPGRQISHFVLKERLGGGGFGEVWRALDENLGRDVALKFPKSSERETGSLMHEARTAASLKHPNIVAIHEVGRDRGRVFIASDFVEGVTLRDRMSAKRLEIPAIRRLLLPVVRALHYAHKQGVVHRDIKPGNILISLDEQPWVTDFGIAKRVDDDETKSYDGQVVGTAKYMSPEQAEGKTSATDRRSDVYSLGVLLFEMLTGEVPYRGTMRAMLEQKVKEDAPAPSKLNSKIPRDLDTICLKCLERDPERRYQTAAELADELEREGRGEPIQARPISQVERLWRWCKRRPLVAGLLAGLIVSLSSGLTGVTFFWRQAADTAVQLRESLYASQMNLISTQLNSGDLQGVRQALQAMAQDSRLDGVRGFEFAYYSGLVEPMEIVAHHGDVVTAVAISRDGDLCASLGNDRKIRVFDTATGEEIRALTIDRGRFKSIDFSPARGVLASTSNDGVVRIWDPRQDARLHRDFSPGGQVAGARYSHNGRWLLVVSEKGPVRIFDTEKYELQVALPTGPSAGRDARFLSDGSRVLVASNDGTIRLYSWSVGTKPEIVQQYGPVESLQSFAISDDEQILVTAQFNGAFMLWNVATAEQRSFEPLWTGRIDLIEFLPNSPVAAFMIHDGETVFVDTSSGQPVLELMTHGRMTPTAVRAANGKSMLYGNSDGSLLRLRLDKLRIPSILSHPAPLEAVTFLPDGQHLLAADHSRLDQAGNLRLWNLTTGEFESLTDDQEASVTCLSVSAVGECVATGGRGPSVLIRDLDSRQVVARINSSAQGTVALAFAPQSGRLAIAPRQGRAAVYAAGTWDQPAFQLEQRAAGITTLQFSPDDRLLAVGWDDGVVRQYAVESGAALGPELRVPTNPVSLQYCQSGRLLAVGLEGGEIHLFNPDSGVVQQQFKAHLARVSALALLGDGRTLVSAGRDRVLKLWDTRNGENVAHLSGHLRQVYALAVSPDGQTIASGAMTGFDEEHQRGEIRLWRGRQD